MDKANSAMIGGGSIGAIAANSDRIDRAANSESMKEAVNLLHVHLFSIGDVFIAPNTIFALIGCGAALYGLYKSIFKKDKKVKKAGKDNQGGE